MRFVSRMAAVTLAGMAASCTLSTEGTGGLVAADAGGGQSHGDAQAGSGGFDASQGTGGTAGTGGSGGAAGTGGSGGAAGTGGSAGAAGTGGSAGAAGTGGSAGAAGSQGGSGGSSGSAGSAGVGPQPECGNGTVEPPEACDDGFADACGACNDTCTGPGSGSTCGDGQVCPQNETCDDGAQDDCGTCNAACTGPGTGQACTASCADGSTEQSFQNGMVGCSGKVSRNARASLCGLGTVVCSSHQWVAQHGNVAPTFHYWIDDVVLYYYGNDGDCIASASQGNACNSTDAPMRVCASGSWDNYYGTWVDPLNNFCNWRNCGLESYSNQYFGGCNGDTTAGALCCVP